MINTKTTFFSIVALCSIVHFHNSIAKKKHTTETTKTTKNISPAERVAKDVLPTDRIIALSEIVQTIQIKVCSMPEFNEARKRLIYLQETIQNLINEMNSEKEYQSNCEAMITTIEQSIQELLDTHVITEEETQFIEKALFKTFFPQ